MSKRPDITARLSHLVEKRLTTQGMYWSPEVNFDMDTEDNRRVDFVGFKPKKYADGAIAVELGQFDFYEVKSCMADFTSGHGLSFYGDNNFLVCQWELAQQLLEERLIPQRVDGILCPDKNWSRLTLKIDRTTVGLKRTRPAAEILWAIVQTRGKEASHE
ncbi:hypothetical protein [Levilactobacillus angrenensis]|uniref:hypothetical protein n=1 Tax=Levilactobacillus angrenensis TaxID=2486020 RepID=UPI000F79FD22|nr:hypothetical protein [Levilactobacillus angrenensis]